MSECVCAVDERSCLFKFIERTCYEETIDVLCLFNYLILLFSLEFGSSPFELVLFFINITCSLV